ncbi:MAG: hypothetical protein QNJ46_15945 [Leptolyngbyaceae cyanobacterium MO_188.B28]|nr:hypothetical protein [Leptolyngbyaceae cyanobacterium MO_188.B28]
MTHCVALCAFLVPANLLVSLQIILFSAFECPRYYLWIMAAASALYASVLVMHDLSWFMIGVIAPPTFVIMFVVALCLGVNAWAIARPDHCIYLKRRLQQLALGAIA